MTRQNIDSLVLDAHPSTTSRLDAAAARIGASWADLFLDLSLRCPGPIGATLALVLGPPSEGERAAG